ncbi:hypothetical protein FRC06_008563, partial [Ceratobasidium sp. 370]
MFRGRSVAIKRDADYQNTIKLVQKSIAKLRGVDAQDILISTTLADYGDALVQISEEIWPEVVGEVRTVEITLDDPTDGGHPASGRRADGGDGVVVPTQLEESVAAIVTTTNPTTEHTRARPHQTVQDPTNTSIEPRGTFSISVRTASQQLLKLGGLRPSSIINDVKTLIETTYNVPAVLQRLDLLGQTLDDMKTLEQYHINYRTILDLCLNARQYMIYFYPHPEDLPHKDVKVKLSLNRAWELVALPPSEEALSRDYIQSMSWTVDVTEAGLLDHGSNANFTHIFWDGISQPAQPTTPDSPLLQSDPEPHPLHGHPNLIPLLDPTNSVAVPFSEIGSYIWNLFYNHMGFVGSSPFPTDFASHIKPKTHEYIAFRLVPQAYCESISSLSISPPP